MADREESKIKGETEIKIEAGGERKKRKRDKRGRTILVQSEP